MTTHQAEKGLLAKKKAIRSIKGAPRWMVTFADLMALLFALFVLLLSFADVDSDSFKRNAGPMRDAFQGQRDVLKVDSDGQTQPETDPKDSGKEEIETWKREIMYQIRAGLAEQIANREFELIEKAREVVIRFPDRTAFASGGAELSPNILGTLDRVAQVLAAAKGQVMVSGHTDDVPMRSARFRSNWDLSTARAVSVVHHLVAQGWLTPERLTAQGFADSRPLGPNDTAQNRAVNRRVEIMIRAPEPRKKSTFEVIGLTPGGR